MGVGMNATKRDITKLMRQSAELWQHMTDIETNINQLVELHQIVVGKMEEFDAQINEITGEKPTKEAQQ